MKNNILFLFLVFLFSCKKSEIEIEIFNEENIQLEKRIEMSLINNSKSDYTLILNNSDTLTVSEYYSIFYKIFDKDFNEIKKTNISILDGEFHVSDDYQFLKQKQQDSLKSYKEFVVGHKDTIVYSFYLKKKFYDTPLSYQHYELSADKIYYISFFVQNLRNLADQQNRNKHSEIFQSRYYLLK